MSLTGSIAAFLSCTRQDLESEAGGNGGDTQIYSVIRLARAFGSLVEEAWEGKLTMIAQI